MCDDGAAGRGGGQGGGVEGSVENDRVFKSLQMWGRHPGCEKGVFATETKNKSHTGLET